MSPFRALLAAHGQTTWNMDTRFTGWTDVDLSERGFAEAQAPTTTAPLALTPAGNATHHGSSSMS